MSRNDSSDRSKDRQELEQSRVNALMTARAARLAREREEDAEERSEIEMLSFTSSGSLLAVRLDEVEGVAKLAGLTAIPGAPSFILGLVRVRGRFVTLVDPRELLQTGRPGLSDATKVVAIRNANRAIALAASEVHDVLSISQKEFDSARLSRDGLSRALTIGGRSLALLDVGAVMRDRRLSPQL